MRKLHIPGVGAVSAIGLGTAHYGTAIDEARAFRLLDCYTESGGNYIDTAHIYGAWVPGCHGASEAIIAKWYRQRGRPKDVLVSTKGCHAEIANPRRLRVTPESVRRDLAQSLERLGLESIPLYWLHRDDPEVPVGELMDALAGEHAAGRVGAIGASNWTPGRIQDANVYAARNNLPPFAASQVGWSLARPNEYLRTFPGGALYMDDAGYAFHSAEKMPLFAFSSQAAGFFSRRYRWDGSDEKTARWEMVERMFLNDVNHARLHAAREMSSRKRTTPNGIALAWLLSQPFPVAALIGPTTGAQLSSSLDASSIRLSPAERDALGFAY